jgi:predicted nucleic acid-binding protein
MYLLDTNTVAELRKPKSPGGVLASLELVAASYNVLPMDAAVFRRWARLMHRTSNTLYEDAMIAATASVHGLTVVTRNVADFKSFGVALLNPFTKVDS